MLLPFQKVKKNIVWGRYRDWDNRKKDIKLKVASLFYFGKNYTIVIETILFTMSILKSKLATALAGSIYTEGKWTPILLTNC